MRVTVSQGLHLPVTALTLQMDNANSGFNPSFLKEFSGIRRIFCEQNTIRSHLNIRGVSVSISDGHYVCAAAAATPSVYSGRHTPSPAATSHITHASVLRIVRSWYVRVRTRL